MKNIVKNILIFALGVGVGMVVTKKYCDKAHELESDDYEDDQNVSEEDGDDDENMTFREFYEGETGKPLMEECDREEYERMRNKYDTITETIEKINYEAEHYNDDVEPFDASPRYNGRDDSKDVREDAYFIPEEEFECMEDWESDEYTLYADGYITDSYGMPVDNDDIDDMLGVNFHTKFEQEGSDQVWVRNERLQMDFSIIRDLDNFEEVAPLRIKRKLGMA